MLSTITKETDGAKQAVAPFIAPVGEEALVTAAKNGSEKAFETLVERYRRRMLAVACRFTRIQEDAEDITQQSFQKAFVHLPTFEGKSSFSTWLTRITVNEALMLLRRSHRRREISIDEEASDHKDAARLEIPDSDPNPEACYLKREETGILSAAIDTLTPGMRKAIELRDLAELSTKETARRMGLSVGVVKSRLSHGRRKLRQTLRCYVTPPRIHISSRRNRNGSASRPFRNRRKPTHLPERIWSSES